MDMTIGNRFVAFMRARGLVTMWDCIQNFITFSIHFPCWFREVSLFLLESPLPKLLSNFSWL